MAKFADAMVATLKALFETGDKPTEQNYTDWIEAIQNGIEEHVHSSAGGAASGLGDAAPVINVQSGLDTAKTATPLVGDIYIATDEAVVYVCYAADVWTEVGGGGNGGGGVTWLATSVMVLDLFELEEDIDWTDLDLSAVVPQGSAGAVLELSMDSPETGSVGSVRKKGSAQSGYMVSRLIGGVDAYDCMTQVHVGVDSNRYIQYRYEIKWADYGSFRIVVQGYW